MASTRVKPDFTSLEQLQIYLRDYAQQRDWEQFHSPKNLVMALSVEASELVELFQWLTPEQSAQLDAGRLLSARHEMADILMYLVRLAGVMDVDLLAACREKAVLNEQRYPADKVRGSAQKYNEYDD